MDIVERARIYATAAHTATGQRRKHTEDPYHIHPMNVVTTLKQHGVMDSAMLAGAWLHDLVEDTKVRFRDIAIEFGSTIAQLVREVTDVAALGSGNRKERATKNADHLAQASYSGATIKYADIIDNAPSITRHDPKFAAVWLAEKDHLLGVMRQGHTGLWQLAREIVDECLAELAEKAEVKAESDRIRNVDQAIKREYMTGRIDQIRHCLITELGDVCAHRIMFADKSNRFIAEWLCNRRAFSNSPARMPSGDELYHALDLYREWLDATKPA